MPIHFKNLFSDSNLLWIQAQLHLWSTDTKCCLRYLAHKTRRLNWRKTERSSHPPDCLDFLSEKKILPFLWWNHSWQRLWNTNTWAGLWTEYTEPLIPVTFFSLLFPEFSPWRNGANPEDVLSMTTLAATAVLILTCFVTFYLEIYGLHLTDCKVTSTSTDINFAAI